MAWDAPDLKPPLQGWNLVITVLVACLYMLIGAGIFYGIEHNYAVQSRKDFLNTQESLFQQGNFSSSQLSIVRDLMTMAAQEEYSPYHETWTEEESDEIWSYGESLYFTLVTLSTVGYGDMSPQTEGGKVFLIFYTIPGIPLMICINLSLGGYVISAVFLAMHRLNTWRKWELDKKKPFATELTLLSMLLLLAFIMTIIFAALLTIQEDWTYFDSLYFTWTTLTTIGYGDLTIENNHYVTASISLIVLLAISFAAASALVAMLTRILHIVDKRRQSSTSSRVQLVDEPNAAQLGAIEMKDLEGARAAAEISAAEPSHQPSGNL
uniref:Potassium channel domain-containing protein n=1 Tax=Lotharella globosa TaxID=91324 RepID=A0A7S4DYR0_9EUKA|mmetsp:Transcript_7024/g.13739  ORF Transcript_7024/g.13739 Transcript_7024/m.13739 type:complete len:323 (-) Transcript_7024:43-1011(-)